MKTLARGISRRAMVMWGMGSALAASGCAGARAGGYRVATFRADVTVPVGHGMMGGAWRAVTVADSLEAHGFVLLGAGAPVVFVSVDWCEIRNEAFERWREALAGAAGTTPDRVMVSTVHQHDAPVADLEAERILRARGLEATVCDPAFHEVAVGRVAAAVRASLPRARVVTEVGMGRARVNGVASNRRYRMPDGSVRWDRMSATRNAFAIEAEEGVIDPWLRTLSFWGEGRAVAAVSFYAVHPMSYYGQGEVSADFPGLARRRRQAEVPDVAQVYVSGCSGNVTAGKYNTGARENRGVLAERLRAGMAEAWSATVREPLRHGEFRNCPVRLEPRADAGFTEVELEAALAAGAGNPGEPPFRQCLRAMGLSWRRRVRSDRPIDVPCLDLGPAVLLLLPGESYVEYQLAAQGMRPGAFVCVAGYGEGATGYVPTDRHWQEGDTNLGDWCWVAPGAEGRLMGAMRTVLGGG